MTERDAIIQKVKKCLRLGASCNQHEAAEALRKAEEIIRKHAVTEEDLLAAEACESRSRGGGACRPPSWEVALANLIARTFGCAILLAGGRRGPEFAFVGCDPAPELAKYSFDVLFRQVKRDRANYIKTALNRCKRANKTRRADTFCVAWVMAVSKPLQGIVPQREQTAAITAYFEKNYPGTITAKGRDRNDEKKLGAKDITDRFCGFIAGENAQINHGVSVETRKPIGA